MEYRFPNFRVLMLAHRDSGRWVAQCLEHDIVGTGGSVDDALMALRYNLSGHLAIARETNSEPFEGIPPAAQRFHDIYAESIQQGHTKKAPSPLRIGVMEKTRHLAEARKMQKAHENVEPSALDGLMVAIAEVA